MGNSKMTEDARECIDRVGDLIAWAHSGKGISVVLVKRNRPTFEAAPYVTWLIGDSGLFWGHYDMNGVQGWTDFLKRVANEHNLTIEVEESE